MIIAYCIVASEGGDANGYLDAPVHGCTLSQQSLEKALQTLEHPQGEEISSEGKSFQEETIPNAIHRAIYNILSILKHIHLFPFGQQVALGGKDIATNS